MRAAEAQRGHDELLRRIRAAAERWKRATAALGLLRVLAVLVGGLASLLVVDGLVVVAPPVRVAWLVLMAAAGAAGAGWWVIRPLARRIDAVGVAARIEEKHPELGERLESSAELWEKRGKGKHGYSIELIDALVLETLAEAAGMDFRVAPGVEERRRALRACALTIVVSAAAVAALGGRLGPALERLARPFDVPTREAVVIAVEPGDVTLISGDDLRVTATITGPVAGAPVMTVTVEGESPASRAMEPARVGDDVRAGAAYRTVVTDVRSDLEYRVGAGVITTETFEVTVIERPFVTGVKLDYEFPSYSGLLPRTIDENNGDITALAGTRVGITLSTSKRLEQAELAFDSGERVALSPAGERSYETTITVRDDARYSVEIVDTDGLTNPDPPKYSILAIRDEHPLVRIIEPGEDREAPREMVLPLVVSAIDDYGVSELTLRYSIEGHADEGFMRLEELGSKGRRELVSEAAWDLSETGLMPGNILVYFVEATDNDRVTGPKTSASESYVVRFPSMAELYSEVAGEHEDIMFDLEEIVEEQAELREQFEQMQEDVRSDPEIEWQEQEEMESALERQEELAVEVDQMAERLSELSDTMSETDRVALETLEKIDEITRLLDEVATEEMRELLEQIRRAMEQVKPEEVSRAMDRLSITQDDYQRRLEQTLNLLRRVKAEQDLADLANRAEDLARRQEQLARDAEGAEAAEQCDAIAEEQDRIREETERLRADLARAIEEMEKVDASAAREMREAASEMDACQLASKMRQAVSKLEERKPSEAASMCQTAANDLLTLFSRLSNCKGGMACSLQNRDREATLRAIDELLGVSREQEEIVVAVEDRKRIPRDELVELVAKEADLADAMSGIADRMFQVSKDSYVIDPSIYRAFGSVQMSMMRAAQRIADGGTSAGHKEARDALGTINSVIVNLLTANQSSSGSSGGALQQLMQQLRRMADQQSELNQMTEELRRQMEELGMGRQVNDELAEMRARQEQIIQEARRLAGEFGDRREILGRLDDTVEEMEAALREMERSGASQETIDRQKRILSRLLDAQRSLRRRDYTRERRSRSGEDFARTSPDDLPGEITRATQELREDLLRAMQRGYPAEYRELIRAYFEGLTSDVEPTYIKEVAP